MIWATCRGKLTPHHYQKVTCHRHQVEADLNHYMECDILKSGLPIGNYANRIKKKPFQDWTAEEQLEAVAAFAHL